MNRIIFGLCIIVLYGVNTMCFADSAVDDPETLVLIALRENAPLPEGISIKEAIQIILSKIDGTNEESKELLNEIKKQFFDNNNEDILAEIMYKIRDSMNKKQFVMVTVQ